MPYTRFAEVVAAKNELAKQVETLSGNVERLVTERVTAATKALETERLAWQTERALLGAGLVDEEAQVVARALWDRVPADKRPEGGIGTWLQWMRADPTTAPKALTPFLGAPPAAAPEARPAPPPPKPGERPPPDGTVITAEALTEATERAQASGDWSEVQKLRAQVLASRR